MDHHQQQIESSTSKSGSSFCRYSSQSRSSGEEQRWIDSNHCRRARQQRHNSRNKHQEEVVVPKKRICIFELPYDWDLQNLPPTVHGGGDRDRSVHVGTGTTGGEKRWPLSLLPTQPQQQQQQQQQQQHHHHHNGDSINPPKNHHPSEQSITNRMWCKSYITTSCDMDDDDLSSLGLDVEEYDFDHGEEEEEERPVLDDETDFCILGKKRQPHNKTIKAKQASFSTMWRKLRFGRTTPRQGRNATGAAESLEKSNQGSNKSAHGKDVSFPSSLSLVFDIITLSTFSMKTAGRSARSNMRVHYDENDHGDSTDRVEDDSLSVETFTSYRWTSPSTQGHPQLQKEQHTKNMTKSSRRFGGRWRLRGRGRRPSIPCD